MYIHLRDKMTLELRKNSFSVEQTNRILSCLDNVMIDYDITSKETALSTITDENRFLLVELYLKSKAQAWKSPETEKIYRGNLLGRYGLFTVVTKSPAEISSIDIIGYFIQSQKLRKMDGEPEASNQTLNGYRKSINSFYEWCRKRKLLQDNPIDFVEKFPEDKIQRDYCNRDELETLRSACADPRETALLEILISTGARRAEVAGIEIGDINFLNNEIRIRCGKGHKDRTVSINARARRALIEYFKACKPFAGKDLQEIPKTTPLFPSSRAPYKRISPNSVYKAFMKIARRAGIEDLKHITTHSMRHSCITLLLEECPIEQVSQYAGHAQISTTQIYNNTPKQKILDRVKEIAI